MNATQEKIKEKIQYSKEFSEQAQTIVSMLKKNSNQRFAQNQDAPQSKSTQIHKIKSGHSLLGHQKSQSRSHRNPSPSNNF